MNVDQAKKVSLPDLLARLGHTPVKERKGGYELWYCSPFRQEKDPSFHTSFIGGKWIWNDFGDEGGTVIDFVLRYNQQQGRAGTIRDVLTFLEDMYRPNLFSPPAPNLKAAAATFSFQQQPGREAAEKFFANRQLEFLSAQPIQNSIILSYLSDERRIPASLARRYLQEIRYRNLATGKEYFAFGMQNQAGGWEIRVASNRYSFKSALNARDITIIPGEGAERGTAHVFEGMTDFLSYLVLTRAEIMPDDAIILHSLSSMQRAMTWMKQHDYALIKTYLDNNQPGQKGTEQLRKEFGEKVQPQNERFTAYTDLNDMLRAYQHGGTQIQK